MVADESDPHLLLPDGKVAGFAPQLYTLDGASYESVQVRPNTRSPGQQTLTCPFFF